MRRGWKQSACFLVWIAGKYRYLYPGFRLGVHSASTSDGKRSDEANEQIRAYLEEMGAPQQVIDLWPQADPRAMNWIVYTQARDWGLFRERPQSIGRFWEMIVSPPSAFYSKPKE
jgi:hypothetical protein